jgi:hypothetical protein
LTGLKCDRTSYGYPVRGLQGGADMSGTKRTLVVTQKDKHIALRLLSALCSLATQDLLIADVALMVDGPSDAYHSLRRFSLSSTHRAVRSI